MYMRFFFASSLAAILMAASGAASSDCPAAPDHSASLDMLIEDLNAARSAAQAQEISNRMWAYWADAPDAQSQAMLDRGMTRRAGYDFAGAITDFDRLVAYCPNYAEGYNQRAFVHFLRQDYAAALPDLDRALDLSPRHIGALSGRALSLYALGRMHEARAALQAALALNPWLPERALIAPGGPLEQMIPEGEEI